MPEIQTDALQFNCIAEWYKQKEFAHRSAFGGGGYKMRLFVAAVTIIAFGGLAAAQHQHGPTPYAGLQQRAIKALSEQQISDLRAGRGMGLALAAELNGYPGPLHVLELADQIGLSDEQRQRVRQLYDSMKAEAVSVGETLIAHESALDRAFAEQSISAASLASLTAQIGETRGRLRAIHLKYRLTTADLLSAHQRHRYAELRGYR
jgi:acetylornithine/succinyldiaminopimelate/putrescine aminotransferase